MGKPRSESPGLDLFPGPEPVQVVRPSLHHYRAFGQKRRPVVGPAIGIPHRVCQLVLDEVGPEPQHLVQDRARHRPEPVHRHPVPRDVQRPERAPQRAAAHRQLPVRMAGVREGVAVVPRQRMDLAKDRHRLTRQGHDVRRAGLRHRVAPLGPLEVDAGPLRRHQLAEAHEHQRCKTERATYGKRSGIAVHREYAEIWGETVEANRKLRTLAMILGGACLALGVLLLRVATVEPPRPIVVRVDEVGRAEAVAYEAATAQADPLDPTTKYFLNRFIADFYSRRRATVEEHWTRSLRFLSTELANAAFTRDGAEVAAMAAGTADTELQVEQVVLRIHPAPEAPHGATADFDLVHFRQGQETLRERWSITVRFTFLTVIPSQLVVYNPMGILITYLQADRALVTEQPR